MKYSDLISFHPIEDVIQLVTADDKNKAREYVKTYVMSDTLGFDYQHFGGHAWQKAIADGSRTDLANRTVNEVAGYADIRQENLWA